MDILEKFNKKNRSPTTKEHVEAIQNPEIVPQWIKRYLELHPNYEEFLRGMLYLRDQETY